MSQPLSGEVQDTYSHADTVILGGGLAGMAAALRLKSLDPDHEILIVDKEVTQSNSLLAGQRYRAGIAGKRFNAHEELIESLANQGETTPQMSRFAQLAIDELAYWPTREGFVGSTDRPEWFGPQWGTANKAGGGRGRSVMNWLRTTCLEEGVRFAGGEVGGLHREEQQIVSATINDGGEVFELAGSNFVLAAGSTAGSLFNSTNRLIDRSSHELAYKAGLSIVGSTTHMFHPFGKASPSGRVLRGCYETDALANTQVYLDVFSDQPQLDAETTELLREHQAHYHMPEIVQRFRRYGAIVLLVDPAGGSRLARANHHYTQLGVSTTDGVRSAEVDNLYAVGDASGVGYWTNGKVRLPGLALTKCLVDARLVGEQLADQRHQTTRLTRITSRPVRAGESVRQTGEKLRSINTQYLERFDAATDGQERKVQAAAWVDELQDVDGDLERSLLEFSLQVARAHQQTAEGISDIVLNKDA